MLSAGLEAELWVWLEDCKSIDKCLTATDLGINQISEDTQVFNLCCQVLSVRKLAKRTLVLTVSDGLLCEMRFVRINEDNLFEVADMDRHNFGLDIHTTIQCNRSDAKMKVGSFIKLSNVQVKKFGHNKKSSFLLFKVTLFSSNVSILDADDPKREEISRNIEFLKPSSLRSLRLGGDSEDLSYSDNFDTQNLALESIGDMTEPEGDHESSVLKQDNCESFVPMQKQCLELSSEEQLSPTRSLVTMEHRTGASPDSVGHRDGSTPEGNCESSVLKQKRSIELSSEEQLSPTRSLVSKEHRTLANPDSVSCKDGSTSEGDCESLVLKQDCGFDLSPTKTSLLTTPYRTAASPDSVVHGDGSIPEDNHESSVLRQKHSLELGSEEHPSPTRSLVTMEHRTPASSYSVGCRHGSTTEDDHASLEPCQNLGSDLSTEQHPNPTRRSVVPMEPRTPASPDFVGPIDVNIPEDDHPSPSRSLVTTEHRTPASPNSLGHRDGSTSENNHKSSVLRQKHDFGFSSERRPNLTRIGVVTMEHRSPASPDSVGCRDGSTSKDNHESCVLRQKRGLELSSEENQSPTRRTLLTPPHRTAMSPDSVSSRDGSTSHMVQETPDSEMGEPFSKRIKLDKLLQWNEDLENAHAVAGTSPIFPCGCVRPGSVLLKVRGHFEDVEPPLSSSSLDLVCGVCPKCSSRTRYTMIEHLQPLRLKQMCYKCSLQTGRNIYLNLELCATFRIRDRRDKTRLYEAIPGEKIKGKLRYCAAEEYISNPVTRTEIWFRLKKLCSTKKMMFFYFGNSKGGGLVLQDIKVP